MHLTINLDELDQPLVDQLQAEAAQAKMSLAAYVLRLIQYSLNKRLTVQDLPSFHDLDGLAGTWSVDEADGFEAAVANFATIDEALWA